MAFIDDLQKSVSDAVQFTAQKTTELTGMAKIKFNMRSEEGKLEKCYSEIGRLFYTAEKEGKDNSYEISTLIMQADKINSDLADLRKEFAKLKKACICTSCGSEISNECVYCPVCGTKVEVEEPEEAEAEEDKSDEE